jgi:hypothetical protein
MQLPLLAASLCLVGFCHPVSALTGDIEPRKGFLGDMFSSFGLPSQNGSLLEEGIEALESLLKILKQGKSSQNDLLGLLLKNTTLGNLTELIHFENKATKNATCPALAVLFARGTTEPGKVIWLATRRENYTTDVV